MAGPVPEDFIDDVRSKTDIVELIGEYVTLKKSGRDFMGLCPFHREKTPSFSVSPGKQMFYCFGCGVGGNVFSFLMKMEGLTFLEAVEELAHRAGLEIPRAPGAQEKWEHKKRYYQINAHAAQYYHRILIRKAAGEKARSYLLGRGVKPTAWERFSLGFAPDSGLGLQEFLESKGYTRGELAASGLFIEHYGMLQERFQGRLIFPICDVRGRYLGFGGRALGEGEPKYLNSPESPVFSKSRNLYGLHLAIPAIREEKRVLVVEGYLDCITAQEHGFLNTVAALGTAFTKDQAQLLLRYTKEVILAFDRDEAGAAATVRSAGYLQELGGMVYVLKLPEAKDPDEFLNAQGSAAFAAALKNSTTTFLEFRLEQLLVQYNPDDVLEKAEIVGELLKELARIPDYVVRQGFIELIARRLNTSEEAVRLELFRYLGKQGGGKDKNDKKRYNMEQDKHAFENRGLSAVERARLGIFRFICQDRRIWQRIRPEIDPDDFGSISYYLRLFEDMDWHNPAELFDMVDESKQAELAELLMRDEDWQLSKQQQEQMLDDYLRVLKRERLYQEIKAKQEAINKCEKNGGQEGIKGLLAEIQSLYEELEALKNNYN
jgi:DNA primase